MYIFLLNLVNRWPLDGSLERILELWLISFIQPWQYQGPRYSKTVVDSNPDIKDTSTTPMKCVERKHVQHSIKFSGVCGDFSTTNCCRVNLTSPKMSLM